MKILKNTASKLMLADDDPLAQSITGDYPRRHRLTWPEISGHAVIESAALLTGDLMLGTDSGLSMQDMFNSVEGVLDSGDFIGPESKGPLLRCRL